MASTPWWLQRRRRKLKKRLFLAQGGDCHLCGLPMRLATATFDHLIPRAHGGHNGASNMALAHRVCNQERGTKDLLLC